jgi:hypothetical protein
MITSVLSAGSSSRQSRRHGTTRRAGSAGSNAGTTITTVCARPSGTADVYDLTVEGEHEFYASGVLIHNCSGFTQAAQRAGGVSIPRTAAQQQVFSKNISGSSLHPGDLGFVGYPAHHVELFMGNNKWAQSPHTGDVTKISLGMSATGGYGRTFDQGGWLLPGVTTAINNTGRPERILPPGQSGGDTFILNFKAEDLKDISTIQDFIDMIEKSRINGRRTARSGTVRV